VLGGTLVGNEVVSWAVVGGLTDEPSVGMVTWGEAAFAPIASKPCNECGIGGKGGNAGSGRLTGGGPPELLACTPVGGALCSEEAFDSGALADGF
jgi:hypothetical protein